MVDRRRKAGLPTGFTMDLGNPREGEAASDKPIKVGDYLDELDLGGGGTKEVTTPAARTPPPVSKAKPRPEPAKQTSVDVAPTPTPTPRAKGPASDRPETSAKSKAEIPRARLNVSLESRRRLGKIVTLMSHYGPEPDVRASEVLEAAILALYEAQESLDLSNVRRRGRFGSSTHRNFPVALSESIARAIADHANESSGRGGGRSESGEE